MATAKQRGDGRWGIQIKVRGVRESGTFATRREAELWAARRTLEINADATGRAGELRTLADAFARYRREVSPGHKGEAWERVRLAALEKQLPCTLPLDKLTPAHFTAWKTARLSVVSASTVAREMNLLSSVLGWARRDWGWMKTNPLADVRRPPQPRHRERIISRAEIRAMLRQLGYRTGRPPASKTELVGYAFLLSLRTGMRAGEIVGMQWQHLHASWVTLPDTKNGNARDVPLPYKARRLIAPLRELDADLIVPVRVEVLDVLFRRARQQAGLDGFRFHDARHTAATRIGRTVGQPGRISFPEFCRLMGWRDPKHALIYVNTSAGDLAMRM